MGASMQNTLEPFQLLLSPGIGTGEVTTAVIVSLSDW